MSYQIVLERRAERAFAALPAEMKRRTAEALAGLARDPRPHGAIKLKGVPLWRVRVGDYRIVYSIDDEDQMVIVTGIPRRNERTYD